jgi:hypothetical protein
MFSFGKLLVLALMIGAVVLAYRWHRRFEQFRAARARSRAAEVRPRLAVEDMVKCQTCGVYIPVHGAGDCGQAGCPYRR